MTKYLGTKPCSLMWLFFLCCFQNLNHIKSSNCDSSYCWGAVQWWADGGGVALTRAWGRCGHASHKFGKEEEWWKAPRGAVSLNYCFSHVLKFTCQGDISVNVFFRSRESFSAAIASFPVPGSRPFWDAFCCLWIKGKPRENCFTWRPVLWRVPCRCDAGCKLWNISSCWGWWKITFLTWP